MNISEKILRKVNHAVITHEFEAWAPQFYKIMSYMMGRYFGVNYQVMISELAADIARSSPGHVLEVGCGPGLVTAAVSDACGKTTKVYGVDLVRDMIAKAKEKAIDIGKEGELHFKEGVAENLPFEEGTFDVIYTSVCFHHFSTKKALSEMYRALKPGGKVIVLDIGFQDYYATLRGKVWYFFHTRLRYFSMRETRSEIFASHFTEKEWRALLHRHGFVVNAIQDRSKKTGERTIEKWLFNKYFEYRSKGLPPLFYIEAVKPD
jgi:ubiquinone/menaquinone biosynthesis C-methylase UbiE